MACRDAHLREVGEADVWSAMRAIGVEAVEAVVDLDGRCPGLFHPERTYAVFGEEAVASLAEELRQQRLRISAFCLLNHFDERADEEVAFVRKVAAAAGRLGVPAIRLDVVPRAITDESAFLEFAIGIGKRLVAETADAAVRFGVENHGGTTNKVEFLKAFLEGVGSERFGLTLDTANFYWFGYPLSKLYEIYEALAPITCHTHCKNIAYPGGERERQREKGWEYGTYCCPIDEGDIDFERVAAILRKHGYRGDLCIENESLRRFPPERHREILSREAALLRRLAS